MTSDAIVVGAGPNGLAAAITLAGAGRSVHVMEAGDRPGGGARTAELTKPGYLHDVCSAFHPLAAASPFFAELGLQAEGLEFLHPEIAMAHPLADGRAGLLHRSAEVTASELGADQRRWLQLVGWAADHWEQLAPSLLGPIVSVPNHPLTLARFGATAILPATLSRRLFKTDEARALLAGCAAHSFMPLTSPLTTALGITLSATAHVAGWPAIAGGTERLIDAMVARLITLGGTIECGRPVNSMADVARSRAVLFDLTPRQIAAIAGSELPQPTRARYEKFRYGPGVFKLDYALSEPIPWTNADCGKAGTVHVGGSDHEIAQSEAEVAAGRHSATPFVLVGQQSTFDPSRTPDNGHTLWAYCHVPSGSTLDQSDAIESQIERFAPGFRDTVVTRHTTTTEGYEAYNPNFVGGDISGGSMRRLGLLARPKLSPHPYRTGNPRLLMCSSSTPPGPGVHGMCGLHAANDAMQSILA